MSLVRRVEIAAGETVLVVPPDGLEHAGIWDWVVSNPEDGSSVDLVDDPGKSVGDGFALGPGAEPVRLVARSERVWAAAGAQPAVLQVLAVTRG